MDIEDSLSSSEPEWEEESAGALFPQDSQLSDPLAQEKKMFGGFTKEGFKEIIQNETQKNDCIQYLGRAKFDEMVSLLEQMDNSSPAKNLDEEPPLPQIIQIPDPSENFLQKMNQPPAEEKETLLQNSKEAKEKATEKETEKASNKNLEDSFNSSEAKVFFSDSEEEKRDLKKRKDLMEYADMTLEYTEQGQTDLFKQQVSDMDRKKRERRDRLREFLDMTFDPVTFASLSRLITIMTMGYHEKAFRYFTKDTTLALFMSVLSPKQVQILFKMKTLYKDFRTKLKSHKKPESLLQEEIALSVLPLHLANQLYESWFKSKLWQQEMTRSHVSNEPVQTTPLDEGPTYKPESEARQPSEEKEKEIQADRLSNELQSSLSSNSNRNQFLVFCLYFLIAKFVGCLARINYTICFDRLNVDKKFIVDMGNPEGFSSNGVDKKTKDKKKKGLAKNKREAQKELKEETKKDKRAKKALKDEISEAVSESLESVEVVHRMTIEDVQNSLKRYTKINTEISDLVHQFLALFPNPVPFPEFRQTRRAFFEIYLHSEKGFKIFNSNKMEFAFSRTGFINRLVNKTSSLFILSLREGQEEPESVSSVPNLEDTNQETVSKSVNQTKNMSSSYKIIHKDSTVCNLCDIWGSLYKRQYDINKSKYVRIPSIIHLICDSNKHSPYSLSGHDLEIEFRETVAAEEIEKTVMPQALSDFIYCKAYVSESRLKPSHALRKDAKPVYQVSGKNIFYRRDLVKLRTPIQWRNNGRAVIKGSEPVKSFDITGWKVIEYYEFSQTEPLVIQLTPEGHIPKNEYGNIEVMHGLPPGTVHLNFPSIKQVLKNCDKDLEYVPAVTEFVLQNGWFKPIIEGIVVHKKDAEKVEGIYQTKRKEIEARERLKQEKLLNKIWKDIFKSIYAKKYFESKN